ncbi:MAG: DMT family transporter [Treponema sp.]
MNTNVIKVLSRLALLTTAIVWGSSLVVVSLMKDAFPPNMVLMIRFSLASVVLALIFAPRFKRYNISYLVNGLIIGVFLFIAYSSQTIGVTTAGGAPGRSGFISASYCVIVPFLAWIFLKERPDIYNISAAVLCVAGLFFVFYKDLVASSNVAITQGDFYALLSGFLFATHIVAVAKFGKGKDPILITITQFVVAAIISAVVTFIFEDNSHIVLDKGSILGIGYLAIMCTAVALLFQTIGQSYTPSSTAAIILGLESIFSIIFAVIWADEKLSFFSILGFFFIFIAILVSETKLAFLRKRNS